METAVCNGEHKHGPVYAGRTDGCLLYSPNNASYNNSIVSDFREYWASKRIKVPDDFYHYLDEGNGSGFGYIPSLCKIARHLKGRYDVGVALARDALLLGYVFERHGLPVLVAQPSTEGIAKDGEASWKSIDRIDEQTIGDKRVLVLELDVLHGRTLRTVAKELTKYSPKSLDIFFILDTRRHKGNRIFLDPEAEKTEQELDGKDLSCNIPDAFGTVYTYPQLKDLLKEKE